MTREKMPTEEELSLLRAILYDTLLASNPIISCNVQERLADLLVAIGRPKLAGALATV